LSQLQNWRQNDDFSGAKESVAFLIPKKSSFWR